MTSHLSIKRKLKTRKPGRPRKITEVSGSSHNIKQRILESAIELIAERGFDGFTLRDVAHKVGVHTALVGYYFGSKSKLEEAALEDQLHQGEGMFLDLQGFGNLPPEEALKALFFGGVKAMTLNRTTYRFLLWVLARGGRYCDELSLRLYSPSLNLIASLLEKLLPNMARAEREARAALFFNLTDGCSHLYWSHLNALQIKSSPEEFLDTYYRIIERQVLPELFRQNAN